MVAAINTVWVFPSVPPPVTNFQLFGRRLVKPTYTDIVLNWTSVVTLNCVPWCVSFYAVTPVFEIEWMAGRHG